MKLLSIEAMLKSLKARSVGILQVSAIWRQSQHRAPFARLPRTNAKRLACILPGVVGLTVCRNRGLLRPDYGITQKRLTMKTLFITLTTTIALTHAAHASDWMWFHGDIGLSSPFGSPGSPANNAATGVVPTRKAVAEKKGAPNKSVARHKFKSTHRSITSR